MIENHDVHFSKKSAEGFTTARLCGIGNADKRGDRHFGRTCRLLGLYFTQRRNRQRVRCDEKPNGNSDPNGTKTWVIVQSFYPTQAHPLFCPVSLTKSVVVQSFVNPRRTPLTTVFENPGDVTLVVIEC